MNSLDLGRVIPDVLFQFFGGIMIGSAVDQVFPSSNSAGPLEIVEAAGQMTVLHIVTQAYFQMGARRGWSFQGDSGKNIAFILALMVCSPKLRGKIVNISQYTVNLLQNTFMKFSPGNGGMKTVQTPVPGLNSPTQPAPNLQTVEQYSGTPYDNDALWSNEIA